MPNSSSQESTGTFWLPSEHVREADRVLGTIETTSDEVKLTLQGHAVFNQVELLPEMRRKWEKRVVGTIATATYVDISDCRRIGVQVYTVGGPPEVTFKVRGPILVSSDPHLVDPDPPLAHELQFEVEGLAEWFARPLGHPIPQHPWGMGRPLDSPPSVEATCDQRACTARIGEGVSLSLRNHLYWGDKGFFDLRIRQATVATISSSDLVEPTALIDLANCFTDFIRFMSGEDCHARGLVFYNHDRKLADESHTDRRVGMGLMKPNPQHRLQGWGDMLVHQRDIAGHETKILERWFRLHAEKRYAVGLLDWIMTSGTRPDAAIVLTVGAIQKLVTRNNRRGQKHQYERFLRDSGLDAWGVDVTAMSERLAELRNMPAHGDPLPAERGALETFWFVVAAMRVYFLRRIGFTEEQCHRIAIRHRGLREALKLPTPEADWNKMNSRGWIMNGVGTGEDC
ncbi:MAG: hypothetical protein F4Z31_22225 [Gemmatimonadetes bacterium]|nr:hypothetical protein [Gemmatimonadota bacterium]